MRWEAERMSFKRWVIAKPDKDQAAQLAEESGIHPFLAYLLTIRGIRTPEQATEFLLGIELTDDPFDFAGMAPAVERIQQAIDAKETMAVFGDYDADGVTATVLLYTYLRDRGARVSYLVPEREETGYGLHHEIVDILAERGVTLMITVDNGIAAVKEVDYAASKGMDVVVTDHHQPQQVLPAAVAVVDSHRPDCGSHFKDYAGVGVAFKLVCALEGDADAILARYADLVAVGTLADVMPLQAENRILVREGLRQLNTSPRMGLQKLMQAAGVGEKQLTSTSAVFSITPRINAAGRMGSADKAVQLLLEENAGEAERLAGEIQQMNVQRQEVEASILKQADALLEENPQWLHQRVLVLSGENWHNGVVGIIAARITERYGKPCIVFSQEGDLAKGSGRSVKGFSLFEAIRSCADMLEGFGGHELAAGVKIASARIGKFRERINDYASGHFPRMPQPELLVDCKLRPSQVDTEKLALLAALEPTGTGNSFPVFGLYNMHLDNVVPIGKGKHLRLSVSRDGVRLPVTKFQSTLQNFTIPCGSTVHLLVTIERNEYRGTISPSLIVRDIRPAGTDQEEILDALWRFECILRREPGSTDGVQPPSRDQLAELYRYLRSRHVWEGPLEQLLCILEDPPVSPLCLLLMLQILSEAALIIWRDRGTLYHIEAPKAAGKADLTQTATMQYLESIKEDVP